MQEDLVVNLIPIDLPAEPLVIHVSSDDIPSLSKIKLRHLERLTPGGEAWEKELSWSFDSFDGSEEKTIAPDQTSAIKKLLTNALRAHCLTKGLIVSTDFTQGLTVLELSSDSRNQELVKHKKFTLRIISPRDQFACGRNNWCINVSFQGEREVTKRPFSAYQAHESAIHKVISGLEIKSIEDLTPAERTSANTKVLVGIDFILSTGAQRNFYRETNKYARSYEEALSFYQRHLRSQNIQDKFAIYESGFQPVRESQVMHASSDSNLLVFGDGHTNFSPYNGLKSYGPNRPIPNNNYKFFFIFHEEDREHANRLFSCLTKGLKGFPGLQRFIGLELNLDTEKTIKFTQTDPTQEIRTQLAGMTFDAATKYIALYISRVRKDDPDPEKRNIYYRIKKALLEKEVSSQVVYRGNIDNPAFNYFLPNISVAILAKLGGIPWRLNRPIRHDLIVGLGAFREGDQLYLGTTVTFKNDGTFVRFNSLKVSRPEDLVPFFKEVLSTVAKEQDETKRIVIHYYKRMSHEEERAIQVALDDLGLKIPYVVLHIVEEKEIIPFDAAYAGRMPTSGTCVCLRNNTYLLCNNTRYSNFTGAKIDDFPFPVSIKISKSSMKNLTPSDIQPLIDEVYQFSRMYWVSVKQKGEPVTILYSEKVASISSAFEGQKLPNSKVATETLWFL